MRSKISSLFLKSFLLYIIIVITFIGATIGFILIYQDSVKRYNMNIYETVGLECASFIDDKINSYFNNLEEFSSNLGKNPDEFYTIGSDNVFLNLLLSEGFDDVIFIDGHGDAHSVLYGDVNLKYRRYFQEAIAGRRNISETIISEYTEKPVNIYAVPVYSDNKIVGVLGAVMPTETLHEIIGNSCENEEFSNCVISRDGVIMLSPNTSNPILTEGMNLFDTCKVLDGDLGSVRQSLYSEKNGSVLLLDIGGGNYYTSYVNSNIPGWVILTSMSEAALNSFMVSTRNYVMLFIIICCSVSMSLVIYLVFRRWALINKVNVLAKENDLLKNVDPVTGYLGESKFFEVAGEILQNSDYKDMYVMLSLDINKFRIINDLHGHEVGNVIITKLAGIIDRNLFDGETFVHMSADLFYVLMKYESNDSIIQRIKNLNDDVSYQITDCNPVISVGIYLITDKSLYMRLMMDRADLARIAAKNSNETGYSFFDPKLLIKVREEKLIESIMQQALESNEFKVYLQPKFDMHNKTKIVGAEALVRWLRNGELVPPGSFIPLFERNGFITKLDRFVFEEVCKQQKVWLGRGYELRIISVNMSRVNLRDSHFVKDLYEICQKYGVPSEFFEIEITESVGFENLSVLIDVFNEIKSFGFHISIDDFGSGYSSLNLLKDLPADVLKIDRAFLGDANTNDRAARIIAHVISLAVSLDMRTICEGIETIDQVNLLSDLGCDMAQGYYFARPMPVPEYEQLVYMPQKMEA